jgi:hypothetical protein
VAFICLGLRSALNARLRAACSRHSTLLRSQSHALGEIDRLMGSVSVSSCGAVPCALRASRLSTAFDALLSSGMFRT